MVLLMLSVVQRESSPAGTPHSNRDRKDYAKLTHLIVIENINTRNVNAVLNLVRYNLLLHNHKIDV
jgi:hypothetical protein